MSLAVTQLIGFAVGGDAPPPVMTWIGATADTSSGTSFTFTNHAIGTAASDRLVVVGITSRDDDFGNNVTISSVTIGGNGATVHATTNSHAVAGVASLVVTSGTTATIVVNVSATAQNCVVGVWTITGLTSTTPVHAPTPSSSNSDDANSMSVSTNLSADGVAVAVLCVGQTGAGAITPSNTTERADNTVGTSYRYEFADRTATVAESGTAMGGSWSTNWRRGIATVSWR